MTSLNLYFSIFKRGWWIVVLASIIAVGFSLLITSLLPAQYESRARYIVSPNLALTEETDFLRGLDTLDRRTIVTTYAVVFSSNRVNNAAKTELSLERSSWEDYEVTAVVLPETNIVEISVVGPEPQRVVDLVDRIGDSAVEYIRSLYQVYHISLLDEPSVPQRPVSPDPVQNSAIAFILGAAIGIFLAVLRSQDILDELNQSSG